MARPVTLRNDHERPGRRRRTKPWHRSKSEKKQRFVRLLQMAEAWIQGVRRLRDVFFVGQSGKRRLRQKLGNGRQFPVRITYRVRKQSGSGKARSYWSRDRYVPGTVETKGQTQGTGQRCHATEKVQFVFQQGNLAETETPRSSGKLQKFTIDD